MKRPLLKLLAAAACAALLSTPASAKNLDLTLDTLLEQISAKAEAAGKPLTVKKVGCRENKKPGDATKTIVSCSHMIGPGRVLITNSEPVGPLIGISTQRWEAGTDGPAVQMMSWIASSLTGTPAADHKAAANKAVESAVANRTSETPIGGQSFVLLDFGNSIVINVSPN